MILRTVIQVTTEALIIATVSVLALPFFVVMTFAFFGM
jgi:hypothetical protein